MFVFQRQEGNKVVNEISINQGAVPKSTYKRKEKSFVTAPPVKRCQGVNITAPATNQGESICVFRALQSTSQSKMKPSLIPSASSQPHKHGLSDLFWMTAFKPCSPDAVLTASPLSPREDPIFSAISSHRPACPAPFFPPRACIRPYIYFVCLLFSTSTNTQDRIPLTNVTHSHQTRCTQVS